MKEYVKETTGSLQTSKVQSLTLCKIEGVKAQLIEHILINNTTLKELGE